MDEKENQGLTIDNSYVPEDKKNSTVYNKSPYANLRFSPAFIDNVEKSNSEAGEEIPAALPLIFCVLSLALNVAAYFTHLLLAVAALITAVFAVAFGTRARLSKGGLAFAGAVVGLLALLFAVATLIALAMT